MRLALVAPEAREAHGGAEFPGFRLLLARDREGTVEIRFRLLGIRLARLERDFASDTMHLGFPPLILGCFDGHHCFINASPSAV